MPHIVAMDTAIFHFGSTPPWHLVAIFLVFFLAGMVKGAIGLGLPTVSIGLLSLFTSPVEAAAMLIVPSFFTNVWQLFAGPQWRSLGIRLWPMLVGACGGTMLGATLGSLLPAKAVTAGLGLALMLYAATSRMASGRSLTSGQERLLGPVAGTVTGAIAGATGVFVLPAVPYLRALGLPRDALMQAMGWSFTVSTAALAVALTIHGNFHAAGAGISCLALIPAVMGMVLGQKLRRSMEPQRFSRCFFAGLFLLGLYFAAGVF
jgi:uncharacterized membrane protein YfcA